MRLKVNARGMCDLQMVTMNMHEVRGWDMTIDVKM